MKLLSVSEKTPLVSFAAIFDPPHLLKCICNLFLKHNVANVECEITVNGERLAGTAQWDVILNLYEVEKRVHQLGRGCGTSKHNCLVSYLLC